MTPKADIEQEPHSLLMAELRWFVRLRWFAGLGVIAAATGNALTQGWTPGVHEGFLIVGGSILGYNLLFWPLVRRYPDRGARVPEAAMAWGQIVPDLAALTLLTVTIYLRQRKRVYWYTFFPMVFMLAVTTTAMIMNLRKYIGGGEVLLSFVAACIFLLSVWLVIESYLRFRRDTLAQAAGD